LTSAIILGSGSRTGAQFYFTARTPRRAGFATLAFNNISAASDAMALACSSCRGMRPSTSKPIPALTRPPGAVQFTGKLNKLTLSIERSQLTPEDNGGVPRSLAERTVRGALIERIVKRTDARCIDESIRIDGDVAQWHFCEVAADTEFVRLLG
jgi:hypothetical protein